MTTAHPSRLAGVLALLQAHRPADPTEAAHRVAMLEHALRHPAPFDRDSWAPGHFTASAFILSPDRDALLLLLHTKLGIWVQPGGHFEPQDESLQAAALREAREETGLVELEVLAPLFDVDIHTIPARKQDPAHQHLDLRLLLRARTTALEATEEMQRWVWTPLAEVERANTDESVMRVARRLLRG